MVTLAGYQRHGPTLGVEHADSTLIPYPASGAQRVLDSAAERLRDPAARLEAAPDLGRGKPPVRTLNSAESKKAMSELRATGPLPPGH
jgi:hypothetical protein